MDKQIVRVILGLKIKFLREQRSMSLTDLSKRSGISKSYLNEMENAKKYPKTDKLISLSQVLEESYDDLVSLKFKGELVVLNEALSQLTAHSERFHLLGMDMDMIADMILKQPAAAASFILSFSNLVNVPSVQKDHLIQVSLAAHKQMHHQYFAEIEKAASFLRQSFLRTKQSLTTERLLDYIVDRYDITIKHHNDYNHEILAINVWYDPIKKDLHLYHEPTHEQLVSDLLKAIYFLEYVDKDISYYAPMPPHKDVESATRYFYSNYFANAFLFPEAPAVKGIQRLLNTKAADAVKINQQIVDSGLTAPLFLERMGSLLHQHFQIQSYMIMRVAATANSDYHSIYIDAKFAQLDYVEPIEYIENYCKKSIARIALNDTREDPNRALQIQHALLHINNIQQPIVILTATLQDRSDDTPQTYNLIIMYDDVLQSSFPFLKPPAEPLTNIGLACQSCVVKDCEVRACEPYVMERSRKNKALREALEKLKSKSV